MRCNIVSSHTAVLAASALWLLLAGVTVTRADETPGNASDTEKSRIEYIQKALKGEPSPVPGKRIVSAGTGFYVTPQRILTNRHVVDGCASVTTRGPDGQNAVATVAAIDKVQDLALVNAAPDHTGAAIAIFRPTSNYLAGDIIGTIGFPDQGMPRIEPFLTKGLVLGPDRKDGKPSRFAVRADIRPGNSGGPVFDPQGLVIGIMNAKLDTVNVYKQTGKTIDNVGFAIANGPIFAFLSQHGVKPTVTNAGPTAIEPDLLAKVKPFTVRLACWR